MLQRRLAFSLLQRVALDRSREGGPRSVDDRGAAGGSDDSEARGEAAAAAAAAASAGSSQGEAAPRSKCGLPRKETPGASEGAGLSAGAAAAPNLRKAVAG